MTAALIAALDASRADFLDALGDVDEGLLTVPGVIDDWSVRDLVVHVAAWSEQASAALDLVASGRGNEFAYSSDETDAMNQRILAEARAVSPSEALRREDAAFSGLRERVASLDPALLSHRLGNLRAWLGDDGADELGEIVGRG